MTKHHFTFHKLFGVHSTNNLEGRQCQSRAQDLETDGLDSNADALTYYHLGKVTACWRSLKYHHVPVLFIIKWGK